MARMKQTARQQEGRGGKVAKRAVGGKAPRKKLAIKGSRKSQPTATTIFSEEKLKAAMTNNCHYCDFRVPQRPSMITHLLYNCQGVNLPGRLSDVLEKIRTEKKTNVLPGTYRWQPCPIGGLCDLTVAQFKAGTVCRPFNLFYLAMDKCEEKIVSLIRASASDYLRKNPNTGEERKRFHSDKEAHCEWERIERSKIAAGEVTEVLIPVTFWYYLEDQLNNLEDRNDYALIVIKIREGKWMTSFYDSQTDEIYYKKACGKDILNS